ncbi:MAG: SpoIIE family protein phosphatase [Clostridia bacterium]|nr:SpoIIE family protein phosphatase [Clostridia bacterium]
MSVLFSRMIGTLAVILMIAAFIGSSDIISKWMERTHSRWKYAVLSGVLGGVFGIYGNISGFELNGAVVSVRDIGPMLAGFLGGPVGGLLAGAIAGIHRLTLGGITAYACVVATCCIGLGCGIISKIKHDFIVKPYWALLVSAAMEAFHLGVVLLMVKPFETAYDIVRQIALPFIATNALGFVLMTSIMTYTERQRSLAIERSRLQSELEVANVIQHSLLPTISADYPGRGEIDVDASMEAAKEVGGDFYDVFFVDKDRLAFVIGDVSGKGVPAALFMASAKITLQNCIRDIPALSEAVEAANNALCARNEAEMFVTLWVGVLDLTSGALTYVNAGHNPPVTVLDGRADFLKTRSGLVLAGMEGVPYKEHRLEIRRGDMICLYTDGVTEAENAQHEMFGEDRLLACFENAAEIGATQVIKTVKSAVDGFVDGYSQFDDITMLCFKYQ